MMLILILMCLRADSTGLPAVSVSHSEHLCVFERVVPSDEAHQA